jgi:hypothetical protein
LFSTVSSIREAIEGEAVRAELVAVAIGGVLTVFCLWWFYFLGEEPELKNLAKSVAWGYGHYFVFGAVAALGATIGAGVDVVTHRAHISELFASLAIAVSIALFMVVLAILHAISGTGPAGFTWLVVIAVVGVLVAGSTAAWIGLGGAVPAMGAALAITLGVKLFAMNRVVEA